MSQAVVVPGFALAPKPGARIKRRWKPTAVPLLPLLGLLSIVVSSFVAGLAAHSPQDVELGSRLKPPGSPGYLLGTDALGRDVFSRLLAGSRLSLEVATSSVLISAVVGISLGVFAGQQGGRTDAVIMRLVEITQGIPLIIIAILLAAVYGPSLQNVIVIVGLFQWPQFARIARAQTMSLRERQFVLASRAAGASNWLLIRRHFLPNLLSSILILASLLAAGAIQAEAGLSFLGAGVPPPTPSWGSMVSDGRQYVTTAWWIALFPGLAISMFVLCLNSLGDYLRDRLDPQLRRSGVSGG